jgi:hypothetical protein
MAKRTNRVAWGLAAILATLVVGAVGRCLFGVHITGPEVDRLIQTELPAGSDRAAVTRFLDSKGWRHGSCETPREDVRNDPTQPEFHATGVIYAGFQNRGVEWFLNLGHIGLTFAFDKRGKLVNHRVDEYIEAL